MEFSSHSALIACSICSGTIIIIHLTFSPPGILTHLLWTVQDLSAVDRTQMGKMPALKEITFFFLHFPDVSCSTICIFIPKLLSCHCFCMCEMNLLD